MATIEPLGDASDEIFTWLFGLIALNAELTKRIAQAQQPSARKRSPARRNHNYQTIDKALRESAAAMPKKHVDVFRSLGDRKVPTPHREPFKSHGWIRGYEKDPHAASSWLSQRWASLMLPAFPRGPQK